MHPIVSSSTYEWHLVKPKRDEQPRKHTEDTEKRAYIPCLSVAIGASYDIRMCDNARGYDGVWTFCPLVEGSDFSRHTI